MSKYIAYLEQAEEVGISCPALNYRGCVTQGETADEALAMIKHAIRGYIISLKRHG